MGSHIRVDDTTPIVVMGVSGAGKSTVGVLLARRLGRAFVDADDLHPPANKAKMTHGVPLDDRDRQPWLEAVATVLATGVVAGKPPVVACSALKRAYRDTLRDGCPTAVFVHLVADGEGLAARLSAREHEFMPADLLHSQIAILEPLHEDEPGGAVETAETAEETLVAVVGLLDLGAFQP